MQLVLTPIRLKVARLLADGFCNADIVQQMGLSHGAIKSHEKYLSLQICTPHTGRPLIRLAVFLHQTRQQWENAVLSANQKLTINLPALSQ